MSEKTSADRSDGFVSIEISEDKMEARATFTPSSGDGKKLEYIQAESAMEANNITQGILEDNISEAIEKCNKEHITIHDVLIARGYKPLKASPEHINLNDEFFNRAKTIIKKDGSVDHKESSPFQMVKKGEILGRVFSYRAGQNGTNVVGESIPFKTKDMQIFKMGGNLDTSGENLVSMVYGRFLIEGDQISVTELLEIGTDVDYHTGNVSFPGEIVIEGMIHDGFRVAAGGSIRCKQIIKNAEVLSRGDLQLDLGVKGRGNALIRVNGHITAKFVEQGSIESRTGISISTSILSSNIYTLGKLIMGQKGIIVTSTIIAEKGIEVFNIGRENCVPSKIWCGVSFVENRNLEHLITRYNILLEKISALEMKKEPPEDLIKKMKTVSHYQWNEIEKLEKEIYTFDDAKIIVNGTLFAGTEIKIYKYKKVIEKDEKRVCVSLDKENLQLVIGPIL
ncbi:MAG: FapA family protein [Spirochaetaceae bacterium]|jgi:uncharacterized protein (DUF342 family)|nr:FapA family protein [Spirochaetaceae bacterium]